MVIPSREENSIIWARFAPSIGVTLKMARFESATNTVSFRLRIVRSFCDEGSSTLEGSVLTSIYIIPLAK